jgi:hypothetical protein
MTARSRLIGFSVVLGLLTACCALQRGTVPARRLPTVTVTCVVRTAGDQPIAGARCLSEGVRALTDEQGVARLPGVPVGARLLVVTVVGYDPVNQPYTASADLSVTVTLVRKAP